MLIFIDGRTLAPPRSGFGNHLLGLLRGLDEVQAPVKLNVFTNTFFQGPGFPKLPSNCRYINGIRGRYPKPAGFFWGRPWGKLLPMELWGHADLYHSPTPLAMPAVRHPVTITIHDLTPMKFPQYTSCQETKIYSYKNLVRFIKQSRLVFTGSYTVKKELVETFNIKEEKIQVIYHAVDPVFRRVITEDMMEQVKIRYGLQRPFIFCLSRLAYYKNMIKLIDAFIRINKNLDGEAELIIAGALDSGHEAILARMNRSDTQGKVRYLGFVDYEDLPIVMKLAQVFSLLSYSEGFGIPVLEAMTVGTPTVISRIPVFKEVSQGSSLLTDPNDLEEIGSALIKAWQGPAREKCIAAGKIRAAHFTWAETAKIFWRTVNTI